MKKRGQIWVETVIYTLIALTMISLVLSFVRPKILEMQDQTILEQSRNMISNIDGILSSISQGGLGNKRNIELSIKKGDLRIDCENNLIKFEMESNHFYSEPEEEINEGKIEVYTEEVGDEGVVSFTIQYSEDYNMTCNGEKEKVILSQAPTSYRLSISHEGYHSYTEMGLCPDEAPRYYSCEEIENSGYDDARFTEIRPTMDFKIN